MLSKYLGKLNMVCEMNTKLLNALFAMILICQIHTISFLIPWNGESVGNHIDNLIANLIL